MGYPESEWGRAMRVQEVMMGALSGELHWFRAAEVLGVNARTMRRWRERFEHNGCHALFDRRAQMRSPRRAPAAEVERVLRLYRERIGASMSGTSTRRRGGSTGSRCPTAG